MVSLTINVSYWEWEGGKKSEKYCNNFPPGNVFEQLNWQKILKDGVTSVEINISIAFKRKKVILQIKIIDWIINNNNNKNWKNNKKNWINWKFLMGANQAALTERTKKNKTNENLPFQVEKNQANDERYEYDQ